MADPAMARLPDRVRAARLLDSSGQAAIFRSPRPGPDGRFTYEARVVIDSLEAGLVDWLQAQWGGFAFGPLSVRPHQAGWQIRGHRETEAFLRVVQPFVSVQKPWVESTLDFLEFVRRCPAGRLAIGAHLQQVSMHER